MTMNIKLLKKIFFKVLVFNLIICFFGCKTSIDTSQLSEDIKPDNNSEVIVKEALVPTNVHVNSLGSGIYDISWDDMGSNLKYKVEYKPSLSFFSKICGETTSNSFRFVTHETTELTFYVQSILTTDENKVSEKSEGVKVPFNKKDVDVLIFMYLDGDNNLAPYIWTDLNEMEEGLKNTSNNVEVIALWDANSKGDTRLYKLGKENNDAYNSISDQTIDITNSVKYKNKIWEINDNKVEANMGNSDTLVLLFNWLKDHYNYKNLILQFSNHGAGPRSLSRAMCIDENTLINNEKNILLTKEVPIAIKEARLPNNKVDLIIQDVCFGSSIEEIYEYKDVANYMLLSPNIMHSTGLDYKEILSHLREGDCISNRVLDIEKFLNEVVKDFYCYYDNIIPDNYWDLWKKEIINLDPNDEIKNESYFTTFEGQILLSYYATFMAPTITAVNVNKIVELKDAINSLADLVLKSKQKIYTLADNTTKPYIKELKNVFINTIPYRNAYKDEETELAFYDIGFLSDTFKNFALTSSNKNNIWPELAEKADNISHALDNVILASWRDGYQKPLYYKNENKKTGYENFSKGSYGIIITGLTFYNNKANVKSIGNYYTTELSFGTDTLWKNFLDEIISL